MAGVSDLNLLRTFLAVYRAGSITEAAKLLAISQPTATAQVRALEQQLGEDLFVRLPRGVEPTPFAHGLAVRVAGPLDALSALDDAGAVSARPVRLAGPAELLCLRVAPALAPLILEGMEIRVTMGLTDALLEELRTGQHDLVISTQRPRSRAFSSVPFMVEEFVLVAAPQWAWQVPAPAFEDMPLITYADHLPIARRYWRSAFGKQLNARPAMTIPDLRGVLSATVAGAGWSVLPRFMCAEELATGRLVELHKPVEPPTNTGYLVQRPGTDADPGVRKVRDLLLDAARGW
ncbi:LysR family transcriptional regulator [Winogradskya humida]|uniref:LysR family transcriptional regulator n=1 Tax=Winogradskya humida TaxID=113566 RepID=A0ABQ4A0G2_9ACTN|nr:LysR family transcriptional regulator [Actinoplanes humidus]